MASETAIITGWDLMTDAGLKSEPERTPRRLASWAALFADWSDEQFKQASLDAANSLVFFPTPKELRDCLHGSLEVRATEAWELVRSAISRHGAIASLTAVDLGGDVAALWCIARIGADELGAMTSENRSIKAAEFRRLYAVATERGYGIEYLPGLFETQNRALGFGCELPSMLGRPEGIPGVERPALGGGGDQEARGERQELESGDGPRPLRVGKQ